MDFLRNHQLNIMLVLQGVCAVMALFILFTKNIQRSRKLAIFLLELTAALLLVADRLAYIYRGDVSQLGWWMVRITNFCVFLFSLLILYSFNLYLSDILTHEGGREKVPVRLRICEYLLCAGLVLLIIAQFTHLYYTFDASNRYQRSEGMILCYFFPVIVLVLQFSCIISFYTKFSRRIRIPLLLFSTIPIVATIAQIFMYGLSLTNITLVGLAIVIYVFAIQDMNEAVERAHRLEVELLQNYKAKLEKTVEERTRDLRAANEKAENLLLNILPKAIAHELSEHPERTISKKYPNATVLFTDIVGFTKMSSEMTAEETVLMLNKMTSLFDDRANREGIEKIKTIGDSYMAASGLDEDADNDAASKMLCFAQGILNDVRNFNNSSPVQVQIRIGINTGNLVAGVIGKTKFIYDVWGDTVNVASRMESTGEAMKIHVAEATYQQTKADFDYSESVKIDVKGKGLMDTYFL